MMKGDETKEQEDLMNQLLDYITQSKSPRRPEEPEIFHNSSRERSETMAEIPVQNEKKSEKEVQEKDLNNRKNLSVSAPVKIDPEEVFQLEFSS